MNTRAMWSSVRRDVTWTGLFSAIGLSLVLAASSCPTSCANSSTNCTSNQIADQTGTDILPGNSLTEGVDCSTCGHSGVSLAWINATTVSSGSVTLLLASSCAGAPLGIQPVTVTVSAGQESASIPDQNAKNLCGDNMPIHYAATVTNNSNQKITEFLTFSCATASTGSSSVIGPTRIR
jgi:hypothetical protein